MLKQCLSEGWVPVDVAMAPKHAHVLVVGFPGDDPAFGECYEVAKLLDRWPEAPGDAWVLANDDRLPLWFTPTHWRSLIPPDA